MSRLSMDLMKVMPRLQKGHRYILCVIDEMTNYLITAPLYQARSEEVGEALIENVISKFGTPEYMIMDQDSMFMFSLMSKKLGISIKTVGPYNHKSLQAEHVIKSLSNILPKCLTGQGQTWHKFLSLATFTYNIFHTPNLGNYSPDELVFGRRPKILINIKNRPRHQNFWYILLCRAIAILASFLYLYTSRVYMHLIIISHIAHTFCSSSGLLVFALLGGIHLFVHQ